MWFNNVEIVAAEKIGAETVTYVSNIYKYYVTYRLVLEDMERQKKPLKKHAQPLQLVPAAAAARWR